MVRFFAFFTLFHLSLTFFSPEVPFKYIAFGGHQYQSIERIKALYDMYKCISIIF